MSKIKRVLVTGASGGIGKAICERLRYQKHWEGSPAYDVIPYQMDKEDGVVDVLINCAGINVPEPVDKCAAFWDVFVANCKLAHNLVTIHGRAMKERGWGRIVNITSLWAFRGGKERFSYAASKAALHALTRSAALELAPEVLVNSVAPGFIDTPMTRGNLTPEEIGKIEAATPLGRLGRPEEVAELVAWLASERNTFVTGQQIICDGGWSI